MTLASSLEDFSLAELFRMVDQGRKSGRLTLCTSANSQISDTPKQYHIWFRQGRVIAAADRSDGQSLITKITERGWLSQRVIERLSGLSTIETPLGLTLKTQGALQVEQLNLLFSAQMQLVWSLFEIHTGHFDLDGKAALPNAEMTGLSLPAMEVALAGLRALKNWQALADALPDPLSAIQSTLSGQPQLRLNSLEWQVWEFAKGSISLSAIAQQINQPIAKVQQACFRLMLAGLVEDTPLIETAASSQKLAIELEPVDTPLKETKHPEETRDSRKATEVDKTKVSHSFLQNLVGFLRSKA